MANAHQDKLYQKVAANLAALISAGEFAGSDRLPAERQRAEMLNVSRATVREALIALECRQLIESRGGSGIYLSDRAKDLDTFAGGLDLGRSPEEIIDLRLIIEVDMAGRAAAAADKTLIAPIEKAVDQGWRDFEAGIYRRDDPMDDADRKFHFSIARASSNVLAGQLVSRLWASLRSPLIRHLENEVQIEQHAELSMLDHQRILDRIVDRDADGARDAMRRHLLRFIKLIGVKPDENAA